MIAGLDFLPQSPRFAVVYNLYSHRYHKPRHLKDFLADDAAPVVDSVVPVWSTANWHEREVYDMMGIRFNGHRTSGASSCLTIGWGTPQRKDYPLRGM